MSAFLKALFQKYAKRLIMKGQEGILQIPNKDRVNLMANNIYKDFKKFGVTDDMIKSENDIKVLHSQIANIEGQTISRNLREALTPKKSADVLDLTGKKIDTSKPILGGKNVPKSLVKQRGPHRGIGAGVQASGPSATRIKQGFSTQSKLNNWSSNQQWVKDFLGRKNAEFNSLSRADQK